MRGQRDWRDLFDLLPGIVARQGSHYAAALEDDDEIADALLDMKTDRQVKRPPLRGWTAERDDNADIKDLLLAILYRGSEKNPDPTPRPQTAVDRVKRNRVQVQKSKVLGQLLPGRH